MIIDTHGETQTTVHIYNANKLVNFVVSGDISYYYIYNKGYFAIALPTLKIIKEIFQNEAGFICGVDIQEIANIITRSKKSMDIKIYPNTIGKIYTVIMKGQPPLFVIKVKIPKPTKDSLQFSISQDDILNFFGNARDLDFDFFIEGGIVKKDGRECKLVFASDSK